MEFKNTRFFSGHVPDRLKADGMSRRYFLYLAGAAGIGALPFIHGCKEADMDISQAKTTRAAEQTAPIIPPIDLSAPKVTASATFGMG